MFYQWQGFLIYHIAMQIGIVWLYPWCLIQNKCVSVTWRPCWDTGHWPHPQGLDWLQMFWDPRASSTFSWHAGTNLLKCLGWRELSYQCPICTVCLSIPSVVHFMALPLPLCPEHHFVSRGHVSAWFYEFIISPHLPLPLYFCDGSRCSILWR